MTPLYKRVAVYVIALISSAGGFGLNGLIEESQEILHKIEECHIAAEWVVERKANP